MTSVHDVLRAVGVEFEKGRDRPALRSECARLATLVRSRGVYALGLFPASDDVAVPAPAMALGRALADASPRPVGVVDVQGTWSCARALAALAKPDGEPVVTSWALESLAVLTPRATDPAAGLPFLRTIVANRGATFGHLVFDLTGLDHLGEHVAAFDALDAVALIARSGRTTTRQVQRGICEIPVTRRLGVLLTGL
jgi:hypothetical protein